MLSALPDGGLRDGSILSVKDELQHFNLQLLISHQVGTSVGRRGVGTECGVGFPPVMARGPGGVVVQEAVLRMLVVLIS